MLKTLIEKTLIAKSTVKKLFTMCCLLQSVMAPYSSITLQDLLSLKRLAKYFKDTHPKSSKHYTKARKKLYEAECEYQLAGCYILLSTYKSAKLTKAQKEQKELLQSAIIEYSSLHLAEGNKYLKEYHTVVFALSKKKEAAANASQSEIIKG